MASFQVIPILLTPELTEGNWLDCTGSVWLSLSDITRIWQLERAQLAAELLAGRGGTAVPCVSVKADLQSGAAVCPEYHPDGCTQCLCHSSWSVPIDRNLGRPTLTASQKAPAPEGPGMAGRAPGSPGRYRPFPSMG